MKIYKSKYKDIDAITVDTGKITAVFLPTEGGKMASLKNNGVEFLVQNSSEKFIHLDLDGSFEQTENAGFDDMFPTIDPTVIKDGSRKGLIYNDHGEVCRLAFDYRIENDALVMQTKSTRLNYNYKKRISAGDDGEIVIDYTIKNLSSDFFNCIWACHALALVRDGGEVITPFNDGEEVDLVSTSNQLYGKKGDRINFNRQMLTFTERARKCTYKLYFPKPLDGGEVAFKYNDGKVLAINFGKELSCLGFWVDDGLKNGRCVGIEPCTRGYDTVYNAQEKGQYGGIDANAELNFSLKISVK